MFSLRNRLAALLERLVAHFELSTYGGAVPTPGKRAIFVCTGNICRSPYCEAKARKCGYEAISCGVDTTEGLPANPSAISEALRRDVDLTAHRTSHWAHVDLRSGDIIIALTWYHMWTVRKRAHAAGCPVILLSALRTKEFEVIQDPYGKDESLFAHVFDLIDEALLRLPLIKKTAMTTPTPHCV